MNHITDKQQSAPRHVAIIMDGNGRWAKSRGLDRSEGHVAGVKTVHEITRVASDMGIKYLSLYTFSTENWNRPQKEVDALMHLVAMVIERETPGLIENNVRVNIFGDIDRLPRATRQSLQNSIDNTAHCTGLTLSLALSYSARWELTQAMRKIAVKVSNGELSPDEITDQTIANNLSTAQLPDPDLLIRTGGDFRISNFMLWQIAYSEIFVTPTLWPDFTGEEFAEAIRNFSGRERRFGLTSEQVKQSK
ncbi:MAG: isoprenyl transferase [Muribaculum sp.]|nr:isoprenyl transferase [Muribaculaceae bacterium]MCM1080208.1 isoprenyl transferase [Muribaculum sp.]